MGATYSYYTDDETARMLEEMTTKERRSASNFLTVLVRAEYERRRQQLTLPSFDSSTPGPLTPGPPPEGGGVEEQS